MRCGVAFAALHGFTGRVVFVGGILPPRRNRPRRPSQKGRGVMSTLGEVIGIAREVRGWTLRDLERVTGISNPLLSQIETGKVKNPGFGTVVKIARALNVSIDRLALTVPIDPRNHGLRGRP